MKRSHLLAATLMLLAACDKLDLKNENAAKSGKYYAVTMESTGFYRHAPSAGADPDQVLKKGALMTLIRPSFAFCKVRLNDGAEGYISNEDIGIAPADLVAAANGPHKSASAHLRFDEPDPRMMPPTEEPLPDFLPTPIPEPANN